ncbi:molybdate ABC transporter substrate-binding protein [Virgibacillus sp. MG-45]|uniref:molybdate ABC transporter substrate-binding protein n=1 Tax=Virgibacillus sp. MG-45 TaxID=3102791 RepID=UPI002EDBB229
MKKTQLFTLLFIAVTIFLAGCSNDKQDEAEKKTELTISAAISLTDALAEIKDTYEKENNVALVFNLGGSGKLAQQIEQGAPTDIFISANQDWMDKLESENFILKDTRADITGNKIVLITGDDSKLEYKAFADINAKDVAKIAIGNPESVPAGKYAQQALQQLEKWSTLEKQLVLAKDVRQVLTYVETGNTDIGFVYESDALVSDKIKVLAAAKAGMHDPIIYPGAVVADTKHEKEAKKFLTFLESDEAQKILNNYGFRK